MRKLVTAGAFMLLTIGAAPAVQAHEFRSFGNGYSVFLGFMSSLPLPGSRTEYTYSQRIHIQRIHISPPTALSRPIWSIRALAIRSTSQRAKSFIRMPHFRLFTPRETSQKGRASSTPWFPMVELTLP